jgi:predicted RNA-binding Zn-ribbon protein involved in translation (DUF1610 family)
MNVTKKAKSVRVKRKEIQTTYITTSYTCPSCYTTFVGRSIAENVTRFICDCGQELIVK